MNMETMNAMKRGKEILKGIHGNLSVQFHICVLLVACSSCTDCLAAFGLAMIGVNPSSHIILIGYHQFTTGSL